MVIACHLLDLGDGTPDYQASPCPIWAGGERNRVLVMKSIRESISVNLKFLREQKGWTQVQAAKEYGVSKGQLIKYEDGRNMPEIERFGYICIKLYGVDPSAVMGLKKFTITTEE